MKLVKTDILAYYIGKVDDSILIIEENRHFLDCPYTLWENIMPLIKDIDKEKIPIYIARPDFFKKKYTYHRVDFLKSKENIDVHSGKDLSFEELPEKAKERILNIVCILEAIRKLKEKNFIIKQDETDVFIMMPHPLEPEKEIPLFTFELDKDLNEMISQLEELIKEEEKTTDGKLYPLVEEIIGIKETLEEICNGNSKN